MKLVSKTLIASAILVALNVQADDVNETLDAAARGRCERVNRAHAFDAASGVASVSRTDILPRTSTRGLRSTGAEIWLLLRSSVRMLRTLPSSVGMVPDR